MSTTEVRNATELAEAIAGVAMHITAVDEVAVRNDTSVDDLGTLTLRGVRTRGQLLLLAADSVCAGHILVDRLFVEAVDVRGRSERPHGFGVEALQGR